MVLDTPKGLKAARDIMLSVLLMISLESTSDAVAQAEEYSPHLVYQPKPSSK